MVNEYMQKVLDENKSLNEKIAYITNDARGGIEVLEQSKIEELTISKEKMIKTLKDIIIYLEK